MQVAACELLYAMTQLGSKMVAVLLKFAEAILENILPLFGMYKLESRVIVHPRSARPLEFWETEMQS